MVTKYHPSVECENRKKKPPRAENFGLFARTVQQLLKRRNVSVLRDSNISRSSDLGPQLRFIFIPRSFGARKPFLFLPCSRIWPLLDTYFMQLAGFQPRQ